MESIGVIFSIWTALGALAVGVWNVCKFAVRKQRELTSTAPPNMVPAVGSRIS